jgi:hypothetical protein
MAKNTAPNTASNPVAADADEWEKEQIGFPPYLKAATGLSITALLLNLDATDPDFPRYTFANAQHEPITCYKGDEEHREDVPVYQGEQFSLAEYAGISREKMIVYMGMEVRLTVGKERRLPPKDGQPRTFFEWELMVKKSDRPMIEARKKELALLKAKQAQEQLSA